MNDALLAAEGLSVTFRSGGRSLRAVDHVDLAFGAGQIVGVAGESGSGKTTLCSALVRALPQSASVTGRVVFEATELYSLSNRELRELRRHKLGMILQNPMTSLDPLYTIGSQVGEVMRQRGEEFANQDTARVAELKRVHLSAPTMRIGQYPHQISGGMKQRVLIAMATTSRPSILVADEPTSALDATIQEEILILFQEIRNRHQTTVIIVSHDLAAIRRVCERIIVMYAGRIVEDGPSGVVFARPRHPYTRGLLDALPRIVGDDIVLSSIPGQVPDLSQPIPGCAFAGRCHRALPICTQAFPEAREAGPAHRVFCFNQEPA